MDSTVAIMGLVMIAAMIGLLVLFWGVVFGERNRSTQLTSKLRQVADQMRGRFHASPERDTLEQFATASGRTFQTNTPYITKQFGDEFICLYFPSTAEGRGWAGTAVVVLGPEENAGSDVYLQRRDNRAIHNVAGTAQ